MKASVTPATSFQGCVQPGSRPSHVQAQPRIRYHWFSLSFDLVDVPPWGLILPVEIGESPHVVFSAEFETAGMPEGTMLGMRWTPSSGNNIHTRTLRLTGSTTHNAVLSIEDNWLPEAEGQQVLLEYELILPDGTIRLGQPLTVQVSQRLAFGTMTVEGLQNGDILHPDRYPDGIPVRFSPIGNVQGYNRVALTWEVVGVRGPGLTLLYLTDFHLPGAPGEDYRFEIPPEGYKDLFNPSWDQIYIRAYADVKLAPEPNPYFYYGYGAQTFYLTGPNK